MALRDWLLGVPETLDGPSLARGIRHGSESHAVRCIRALGERDEEPAVDFLLPLLSDPRAAVRRNAAAALGHLGRPRALPALQAASAADRTEEGRVALAVARVRCGEPVDAVLDFVRRVERRTLLTHAGPRQPQQVGGVPALTERFWLCLGDAPGEVRPRAALRADRLRRISATHTDTREAIQGLGALRHPGDLQALEGLLRSAGRREEHAVYAALGLHGDPRALPRLTEALFATDVDPGRGFAQRRLCATAIGRLGLRESTRPLLRALENEALDFEGRPGAGMGVQYPVRTNLLWALGEVADPETAELLVSYLPNLHGSAFGGFYLPAMDALVKLGRAAEPAVRRMAREGGEVEAANAVGVLAALGVDVTPFAGDRRRAVAEVARRAREGEAT